MSSPNPTIDHLPYIYQKCFLDNCCLYQPVKWVAAGLRSIEKIPEDFQEKQWVKLAFDIAKVVLAVLAVIATLLITASILSALTLPTVVVAIAVIALPTVFLGEIMRQSAQNAHEIAQNRYELGCRRGFFTTKEYIGNYGITDLKFDEIDFND